jgi:hypothetical protein
MYSIDKVASMTDRRQYERLSYQFPVRLETLFADEKIYLDLVTRDLSASGIFIPTLISFQEGTMFFMSFTFPSKKFQILKRLNELNGCVGNLVRSAPDGIAIRFDIECQWEYLKKM